MQFIELFSNNARGVLAQAVTDEDEELILDSPDTSFEWPAAIEFPEGRSFQRATLFHPSNPDEFEIVFIVGRAYNGVNFSVERGQEGTSATNWPVGTVIEARVTAGMLESFVQNVQDEGEDGAAPVINLSEDFHDSNGGLYLRGTQFVPGTRGPGIGRRFQTAAEVTGRPLISRTLNVSIGTLRNWESNEFNDGGVFKLPDIPGFQFTVEGHKRGWLGFFDPPEMSGFNPQNPYPVEVSTNYQNSFITPSPYPVNTEVYVGSDCLITEVGFVSMSETAPATTTPLITIKAETGSEDVLTLADSVEITDTSYKSVHRLFLGSASSALVNNLKFTVDRPSSEETVGYFYWVALPFAD